MEELRLRLIPELESKTEALYPQIVHLGEHSEIRHKLEREYSVFAKDLRLRCDELNDARLRIKSLELQKTRKR